MCGHSGAHELHLCVAAVWASGIHEEDALNLTRLLNSLGKENIKSA